MAKKLLAFDLEIKEEIPEGETDWKQHRPLGITCAAAASSDGDLWNWWANDRGKFTPQMSEEQCSIMVLDLCVLSRDYHIVTWNGLGFDFDILHEETRADIKDACISLARSHIDLMFQFHCTKGYPLGLNTACKGMGLPGKTEGMDGAQAPVMWANGEYHKVLEYVSQDVKATLALAQKIQKSGALNWVSRAGRLNQCEFPELLTAKAAAKLPQPDASWMTDPWPRSKFYGWLGSIGEPAELDPWQSAERHIYGDK